MIVDASSDNGVLDACVLVMALMTWMMSCSRNIGDVDDTDGMGRTGAIEAN